MHSQSIRLKCEHEENSVVSAGSRPSPRGSNRNLSSEWAEASLPALGLHEVAYEKAFYDWEAGRVIGDLKATVGEVMAVLRRR